MKKTLLQAHRGVSTDYPENTMSAFVGAVCQEYDIIELDLAVTADDKLVVLHDDTINRTGRYPDGAIIENEVKISDITYDEALLYDFGQSFGKKYKGEKIPLFSDALSFAKDKGIMLKIDNKFQSFAPKHTELLFEMSKEYVSVCAYTVNTLEYARLVARELPGCEVHYDGEVTEEILKELTGIIPREKLTVWLPFETEHNSWVKSGFATEALCRSVKEYARLGLWILSEYRDFEKAKAWGADIVETTGKIKPVCREGVIADVHIHSEHSHDSMCPIQDMKASAYENKVDIICITDHIDIEWCDKIDMKSLAGNSIREAKEKNEADDVPVQINSGIELGEAIWDMETSAEVIETEGTDQVIGSVHAVRYEGYTEPYSQINFAEMGIERTGEFLDAYFDDVTELINTVTFDILAHLTCPFRYINGKYNMGIDCKKYEKKIETILSMIIERRIALEVNTSCKGSNYDEYLPEEWIIKRYRQMGGHLITCGSDAHISENVSHGFKELFKMLKKNGFEYVCYFKDRYIYQCTLKQEETA